MFNLEAWLFCVQDCHRDKKWLLSIKDIYNTMILFSVSVGFRHDSLSSGVLPKNGRRIIIGRRDTHASPQTLGEEMVSYEELMFIVSSVVLIVVLGTCWIRASHCTLPQCPCVSTSHLASSPRLCGGRESMSKRRVRKQ